MHHHSRSNPNRCLEIQSLHDIITETDEGSTTLVFMWLRGDEEAVDESSREELRRKGWRSRANTHMEAIGIGLDVYVRRR